MISFNLKNNSLRGKTALLLLAGIVFLSFFSFSVYNQYFADTISRYVPAEAAFYVRFSLPKIKSRAELSDLASRTVTEVLSPQLTEDYFDISPVKRELAIVGAVANGEIHPAVIIRTDRPGKTEEFFKERRISYKFLAGNYLVAANRPETLDFFSSDRTDISGLIKSKFSRRSSVNVFISSSAGSELIKDSFSWNIFLAGLDLSSDIFANARVKGGRLEATIIGKESGRADIPDKIGDFDFVLSTGDFSALADKFSAQLSSVSSAAENNWAWWRERYFGEAGKDVFGRQLVFAAAGTGRGSGWPVSDFDFCLNVYFPDEAALAANLPIWEETIKKIIAERFFSRQSVWLDDGTRVVEYRPLYSRLDYGQDGDLKIISATSTSEEISIFYASAGPVLRISNNKSLSCDNLGGDGDYIKWNTSLAPFYQPFDFLNAFKQIEASGDKVIFR